MTTQEKLIEFQKAYEKILVVTNRIVKRINLNKIKSDQKIHYGIHRLIISGTEYFYSMYILKMRNTTNPMYGKYKVIYDFLPYTIQTHRKSGNKYIISFGDLKRKPEDYFSKYRPTGSSANMIVEYEYHVFKRYAERFLEDLKMDAPEALEKFLITNQDGIIQYYGKDKKLVARVSENGICLGVVVDDSLLKFKTFITEKDLRENQRMWSKYGDMWTSFIKLREYEFKTA